MELITFAASLRADSANKKLINLATKVLDDSKIKTNLLDFSDIVSINYDADIQNTTGFPDEIMNFVKKMRQQDGLVISSPEYNFSIPGTLKNVIDWVSRLDPMPWKDYPILLLSASPSLVGGNRALWSTLTSLEACGAYVFPSMFSLASAHSAFDKDGQLNDKNLMNRLEQTIQEFIPFVRMVKQLKKKAA